MIIVDLEQADFISLARENIVYLNEEKFNSKYYIITNGAVFRMFLKKISDDNRTFLHNQFKHGIVVATSVYDESLIIPSMLAEVRDLKAWIRDYVKTKL